MKEQEELNKIKEMKQSVISGWQWYGINKIDIHIQEALFMYRCSQSGLYLGLSIASAIIYFFFEAREYILTILILFGLFFIYEFICIFAGNSFKLFFQYREFIEQKKEYKKLKEKLND